MLRYSVIVTAHNMAKVIVRTLLSVEAAIEAAGTISGDLGESTSEIVVVDDGSSDETWGTIESFVGGRPGYVLIQHAQPTNPSHARNAGVQASSGQLLFFLDGDDLFYPDHIAVCLASLDAPGVGFVKTQVHIADPIHPEWIEPINYSVVINFCVRRACHEAVGGFPDFLLCTREQGQLQPVTDIFFKFEDMYYSQLITKLFPGYSVNKETVENIRYPGNSFDRQYQKFTMPYGAYQEAKPEEENYRLQLCDTILEHRLHELRVKYGANEKGFLLGVL